MNRKKLVIILLCVVVLIGSLLVWISGQFYSEPSTQKSVTNLNQILEDEKKSGNSGEEMVVVSPSSLRTKYAVEFQTEDADSVLLLDICDKGIQPDVMEAKAAIIRKEVDYLIASLEMEEYMSSIDCSLVDRVSTYGVYRVNNNFHETVSDINQVSQIMEQVGLNISEIKISLTDDTDTKGEILDKYLVLNDLHVILTVDDTTAEYWDTINQRYTTFALTGKGVHSADAWQGIAAVVDAMGVDGLLLAGDMIDFGSTTNFDVFQKGLGKISTPILYARSDHDMSAWYNSDGSYTKKDVKAAHKSLKAAHDNLTPMENFMVWDKGEYYIVAWNNSTSQLSEKGLARAKDVFATGKPVILITHVPINSTIDDGLFETSKELDHANRAKLWGKDCYYQPNQVTDEFIHMVVNDNSPVRAVIAGHLHFSYEVMLNKHCVEYVCNPSFSGNMTQVTVVR